MFYSRKGPNINFLGPEKRPFPGGSPVGSPAQKAYVYVVFSPLMNRKKRKYQNVRQANLNTFIATPHARDISSPPKKKGNLFPREVLRTREVG